MCLLCDNGTAVENLTADYGSVPEGVHMDLLLELHCTNLCDNGTAVENFAADYGFFPEGVHMDLLLELHCTFSVTTEQR